MPHNRFYVDESLEEEKEIILSASESHHLSVSRVAAGECVELINGKGVLALAERLEKNQARLRVTSILMQVQPHKTALILAQGLARMNHLEWIIEKGTELGVSCFWLFPGLKSERQRLSENQLHRLNQIMIAAIKQCGQLYLPQLELKPPLQKWPRHEGTLLYADPSHEVPFLWNVDMNVEGPITLFVGPEAGFDEREILHLKQVLKAQSARLHRHTLRTETAALAALSLAQVFIEN